MPGSENLKGTPINKPYLSSSLQISPGVQHNRPASGEAPKTKGSWYEGMSYGNSSDANIFFYGAEMVHKPAEYVTVSRLLLLLLLVRPRTTALATTAPAGTTMRRPLLLLTTTTN